MRKFLEAYFDVLKTQQSHNSAKLTLKVLFYSEYASFAVFLETVIMFFALYIQII